MSAGCELTVAAAWIAYLVLQKPYVNVYKNSNISTTVWGKGHEIKKKMGSFSENKIKIGQRSGCWWAASEAIVYKPAFAEISPGHTVGERVKKQWWTWVQHRDPSATAACAGPWSGPVPCHWEVISSGSFKMCSFDQMQHILHQREGDLHQPYHLYWGCL